MKISSLTTLTAFLKIPLAMLEHISSIFKHVEWTSKMMFALQEFVSCNLNKMSVLRISPVDLKHNQKVINTIIHVGLVMITKIAEDVSTPTLTILTSKMTPRFVLEISALRVFPLWQAQSKDVQMEKTFSDNLVNAVSKLLKFQDSAQATVKL